MNEYKTMSDNTVILNKLSQGQSEWRDRVDSRHKDADWLKKSAMIAVKVLSRLHELGMSQKQLAEVLRVSPQYVSKIVKGQQNLTLETISKLERILGMELVTV